MAASPRATPAPGRVRLDRRRAGEQLVAHVCHYMNQPLVELYGGCMVVLKISWCGISRQHGSASEAYARAGGTVAGRIRTATASRARHRAWMRLFRRT